jgi:hypothetical protein
MADVDNRELTDAAGWDRCEDSVMMLDVLNDRQLPRSSFRLLCYECCRRIEHLLPNDEFRAAVPLVREWAEGRLADQDRAAASDRIEAAIKADPALLATARSGPDLAAAEAASAVNFALWEDIRGNHGTAEGAGYVLDHASLAVALSQGSQEELGHERWHDLREAELRAQADIIRRLFDNPFREPPTGE